MEDQPREMVIKTSRIYFIGNYILGILGIIFIILIYFNFHMKFSLVPKTVSELTSTMELLAMAGIVSFLLEQPEIERFRTRFFITMNEVIKEEGILRKERVILPYATVADVRVEMGVIGRFLNYGNLSVGSFKAGSDMVMKGVRKPEKMHVMIQNRVNLIREGQIEMFETKDGRRERSKKVEKLDENEDIPEDESE